MSNNDTGLSGEYDKENVFALILRGELPCHRIHEDAHSLAFLDVFPKAPGHSLVIPKNCTARTILEVPLDILQHCIVSARIVAEKIVLAMQPDALSLRQHNGALASQEIFHLHFHVVPHWQTLPETYAEDPTGKTMLAQTATLLESVRISRTDESV